MLATPVVLIAFNRPEATRRSFAAIRAAQPRRLFLLCDGARPDRPADPSRTAAVRAELDRVDWPCEVTRRYNAENRGCEANVETGLDLVFSEVDRAIVLEDDCVADATFFRFAEELLDRYQHDERVWHIAGNSHAVPTRLFGGDSYAFSTWASVWGWATWADRWQHHRSVFPRDHVHRSATDRGDAPRRTVPAVPAAGSLVTRAAERHFAEAAVSADVVTHGWDKHWWLTIMSEGGLSVTPALNLVANVGFGADATHGIAERPTDPAVAMPFPLRHPPAVALDVEVERELEMALNRVGGRTAMTARRLVRSPMLRRLLRRAADSPPAVGAARAVSRLTQRRRQVARTPQG